MKLFKKIRKGFTLIELVVVIAVIAILSAVSIVSYVSITNKAKQSNDQQKIDQVNLSLAALEVDGKPKTMYEAVKAVEDDGFKPENFKEEAKNYRFAYAMEENKFVIVEKQSKVVYPKDLAGLACPSANLWLFEDAASAFEGGFSRYLRGEGLSGEVSADAGIDVGDNSGISKVTYVSSASQDVVIRTNGQFLHLVIDASASEVKHFGNANIVDITAVKKGTYEEHGSVSTLNLNKGKVKVMPGSIVGKVDIDASATSSTVEVVNNGYVFETGVINYDTEDLNHQIPETVPEAAEQIIENVPKSTSDDTIKVDSAESLMNIAWAQSTGVLGDISLKIEITNNIDISKKVWVPFGANPKYPFSGTILGKNHKITGLSNSGYVAAQTYISSSLTSISAYGFIALAKDNVTIKDLSIDLYIETNDGGVGGLIAMHDFGHFTSNDGSAPVEYTCLVENVTMSGTIIAGDKSGGFMSGMYSKLGEKADFVAAGSKFVQKVIFRNCTNKVNLTSTGTMGRGAGFIAASNTGCGTKETISNKIASPGVDITASIEFDNCKNLGTIVGVTVGGFISQASPEGTQDETYITFKNGCSNSGTLTATSQSGNLIATNNGGTKTVSVNGVPVDVAKDAKLD